MKVDYLFEELKGMEYEEALQYLQNFRGSEFGQAMENKLHYSPEQMEYRKKGQVETAWQEYRRQNPPVGEWVETIENWEDEIFDYDISQEEWLEQDYIQGLYDRYDAPKYWEKAWDEAEAEMHSAENIYIEECLNAMMEETQDRLAAEAWVERLERLPIKNYNTFTKWVIVFQIAIGLRSCPTPKGYLEAWDSDYYPTEEKAEQKVDVDKLNTALDELLKRMGKY